MARDGKVLAVDAASNDDLILSNWAGLDSSVFTRCLSLYKSREFTITMTQVRAQYLIDR